jgi:hypothetical protein
LNHCLDESGAPDSARERAAILSKMINIPRQLAWSFIGGHQLPDEATLKKIATEFEVNADWLSGENDST